MARKYRVMISFWIPSKDRSSSFKQTKVEGEFDEHNLPAMRKQVCQITSKFLRKKINGHVSIQETNLGLTQCLATISVDFPEY